MWHASTEVIRLSDHARKLRIASHPPLCTDTLERGVRFVVASENSGYGDAGTWALVRNISVQELQEAIKEVTIEYGDVRQSDEFRNIEPGLAEGEGPIWHIVCEDILDPNFVLTTFFVQRTLLDPIWGQIETRIVPYFESDSREKFPAEAFEQELLDLEEVLKPFYQQAKDDSKWNGQLAYRAYDFSSGRRTLLNAVVLSSRKDLLPVILKFTHEGEHGQKHPWFVLGDLAFGLDVLTDTGKKVSNVSRKADHYGNTAFHTCAYDGRTGMLKLLVEHVEGLGAEHPRFEVLLRCLATGVTKDDETVLNTACRMKRWACYDVVKAALHEHRVDFVDPLPGTDLASHYVQRDVDEPDSLPDGMCRFRIDDEPFLASNCLSEFEVNIKTKIDEKVSGLTERPSKLTVEGLAPKAVDRLDSEFWRWAFQFEEVVFTSAEVPAPAMMRLLDELTRFLEGGEKFNCTNLGLGIRPPAVGDDGEGATGCIDVECLERLKHALINLLGRELTLDVKLQSDWRDRLSRPDGAHQLVLFDAIANILDYRRLPWRRYSKAAAKNPLSKNPFMPGLCAAKNIMFDGAFKSLCGAHTLREAVRPQAFQFLSALEDVWRQVERVWTTEQARRLRRHLQKARRLKEGMESSTRSHGIEEQVTTARPATGASQTAPGSSSAPAAAPAVTTATASAQAAGATTTQGAGKGRQDHPGRLQAKGSHDFSGMSGKRGKEEHAPGRSGKGRIGGKNFGQPGMLRECGKSGKGGKQVMEGKAHSKGRSSYADAM